MCCVPYKEVFVICGYFEGKLEQAGEGFEWYTSEAIQELAGFMLGESDEFEVKYPRRVGLISQVMATLSNMRI